MPFRKMRIRFNNSFGSSPREVVHVDAETGASSVTSEECNKPLPDARLFDVDTMIKAGVTLNEVNTKILSSGVDSQAFAQAIDTLVESKKKSQNNNKKEVNNEN